MGSYGNISETSRFEQTKWNASISPPLNRADLESVRTATGNYSSGGLSEYCDEREDLEIPCREHILLFLFAFPGDLIHFHQCKQSCHTEMLPYRLI